MSLRNIIVTTLFASTVLAACGPQSTLDQSKVSEAWDHLNAPRQLGWIKEHTFEKLALSGRADQTPWVDSYWPTYEGGLAARWNGQRGHDPFEKKFLSAEEISSADEQVLASLSPAEKYDLAIGDLTFPLTNFEVDRTSPDAPTWWGLCHGWAPAALNFEEPAPVVYETENGLKIPFGSSDVKALLTFAQQYNRSYNSTKFLGARCNTDLGEGEETENKECQDVNAGSFHLILSNHLGLDKNAFVADVTRDDEVWNHPVFGFTSQVLSRSSDVYKNAARGTVEIVEIETQMQYAVEVQPHFESYGKDDMGQYATANYHYYVELDKKGEIIGGEWVSFDRPDFLWIQTKPELAGFFSTLKDIYEQSISK